MEFAAVIEAREVAKSHLGTLREAMRLRREREKLSQTNASTEEDAASAQRNRPNVKAK